MLARLLGEVGVGKLFRMEWGAGEKKIPTNVIQPPVGPFE